MNFQNAIMPEYATSKDHVSFKVGTPIISKNGNNLDFDIFARKLKPFENCTVRLSVNCITEETINEYLEIMVKDSESVFF